MMSNWRKCRDKFLWSRFVFQKRRSFKMGKALKKVQYTRPSLKVFMTKLFFQYIQSRLYNLYC